MRKVIKNGTVITMDDKRPRYENIDIVIDDSIITDLVKNYNGEADLVIDASDKIVMPGLINAHTHLGMSLFRATNDDLTLDEWLNNKIWPIEDKLTDDDIYYGTLLSCIEMIKTGSVVSNDMYYGCDGSLRAIKETKMRALFGRCLMDIDGKGEERLEDFKRLYQEYKNDELIKFSIAPHALYTCSLEYLKKCSDLALELNLPYHIHFCENMNEVKTILDKYHNDPVQIIEDIGLFRNKLILAHATFVNSDMLDKFKGHDVSFVHNPVSNLNLGCGIADITEYKKYVNICLGTDGQGSGNNMNLFYHMSMVDNLQKGKYMDPTIMSSYQVLKMATINGAKALGMDDYIGSIEVGKKADIIMIDLNSINTYPTIDLITNIVHNTESSNVDMTMINGEILMLNKKILLDIDFDDIKKKINKIIERVMS